MMKVKLKKQKKSNLDYLLLIGWTLVLIAFILVMYYNILNQFNSCTSDPFDYGVKKLRDNIHSVDTVSGSVTVVDVKGRTFTEYFGDPISLFNLTVIENEFP